jgi:ABC-type multidrug transport system fused ATPase/permease subunit
MYKIFFRLVPELYSWIYKALAFTLVIELLKLTPPYLLKIVIDLLILGEKNISKIFLFVGAMLVIYLTTTFVESKYYTNISKTIFNLETSILKKAHNQLLKLGLDYHESNPSGELVQLMNEGGNRLSQIMWFFQDQFLGTSLQLILTCLLLLVLNWKCALILIFFLPIVIWQVARGSSLLQPYRERYHAKFREASWVMNQSIINIRTVKDFVREDYERERYNNHLNDYLQLADERINFEHGHAIKRDIVLSLARICLLTYCVYLVFSDAMTAGTLFLFSNLSEKAISSVFRLSRLYAFLCDSAEIVNQFAKLFQEVPSIQSSPNAASCGELKGEVEFKNTSFSYNQDSEVLSQVNLKIPAKKVVAFVGRSGSGKSTMIKLLSRHYDISEGEILVDNVNIKKYKLNEYREKIAVVSQDIEVFDQSIANNIAYGLNVDIAKIEQAAKSAHIHEFITTLPEGYDTRVGERGLKLSGGQKQRLGIARALVREPAVLILDEATSSLDTESEQMIQRALKEIHNRQTIIIIAHRLSTIESADLVVVFDQGSIIEVGNHNELINQKGHFARMKDLQALGEIRV